MFHSKTSGATTCLALGIFLFAGIARPDPAAPEIAPSMYVAGNLRVAVTCAESFVTLDQGLRVSIDGVALKPLRTNFVSSLALDSNNNQVLLSSVTDVGFVAPAGRHRVRIEAPDCVPDERDIDVSPTHARYVEGRLPIESGALMGTVGAPNGIGITLGYFSGSYPRSLMTGSSPRWSSTPTTYAMDAASVHGVLFTTSVERRWLAFGLDTTWGWGSATGRLTPPATTITTTPPGPYDFSASLLQWSMTLRLGARLPLRYVSFAAGSGVGFSLWITNHSTVDTPGAAKYAVMADAPTGADATWHVPLWASATIKPFCHWGVQALASYQVQPTNTDGNTVMLGAGIVWQPSAACSEEPGLDVTP